MNKIVPTEKEYIFDGKVALSQTDLKGKIIFVNRKFCEISGYTAQELLDGEHKIIRHPDMPSNIYENMYKALKNGRSWGGLIKNLRKDGCYYWVDFEIVPVRDIEEDIAGYMSISKPAPRKNIADIEKTYEKLQNSTK